MHHRRFLVSSQLLYLLGTHDNYGDALFEAAMATITGTGISADETPARIIRVALAVYSVVVFATLAGSLGAFFLDEDRRRTKETESASHAGESPG